MTYCLGILTREGLVLASDSHTHSGIDQLPVCCKMYTFVKPGERVFVLLASGNLSLTQSIVSLLGRDFDRGTGLASAATLYDAVRLVGDQVRAISELDRAALERDEYKYRVHFLLAGQIKGQAPELHLVYPQGNPLQATEDSPFLQIGEHKYGRPILVRGIQYRETSLEEAAKYALISMDSTMRSNVTVGPPIDLVVYRNDELEIYRRRRLTANDPDLLKIRHQWEQALRKSVQELPAIDLETYGQKV